MNEKLRKERIGITYAATILNVSVRELKDAVHRGVDLRGLPAPVPVARGQGPSRTQISFYLGDIMDMAEAMKHE